MIDFIYKILFKLFGHNFSQYFTGVLTDTRTQSQKDQDYAHEERAAAVTTDPFGNVQITESPYPYQNQFGTSSCVPHAIGMAYAIERGVKDFVALSYIFAYRLRSNYAGEGSVPAEMFGIYHNFGAPLYSTLPTPQTESQANAVSLTQQMYTEAKIYRGANYYRITSGGNNIDNIAAVAQQGHAVVMCLFATYDEWARQYPVVSNPNLTQGAAEVNHEICVLPYSGFIKDGVKYVAIQDSAWFGGWKLRYVSETFIKMRVTESRYWVGVQTLGVGPKPVYTFTQNLSVGSKGPEVIALQKLLISEGLIPNDCATGNFLGITLAGVKAFQDKYASDILLPNGLLVPTGYWGPASIKMANKLTSPTTV